MNLIHQEIWAKSDGTPLMRHLLDVAYVAHKYAREMGVDFETARMGALLHDIGKTSPVFQRSLRQQMPPNHIFRHEIASLLFISLAPPERKDAVIEMIASHHKSLFVVSDGQNRRGLLDLEDDMDSFEIHSRNWDNWSNIALEILSGSGLEIHPISINEAKENYDYAVDYCNKLPMGCSQWKGLLMAADHFVSALGSKSRETVGKLFVKPDLDYYANRKSDIYPLSLIEAGDSRKHTLLTAPTGAGKTDFLMRRCSARVFYILPYQASINAMYDRFINDLDGTESVISLRHSTSKLKIEDDNLEESIIQDSIGSSIKVMTPQQIAMVVFGIKGYESMLLDMSGNDVILDEIHTYSGVMQSIVWRIVEILVNVNCRVHIGTATMPSCLYDKLLALLGGKDNVYEVKLPLDVLDTYNRHVIYKVGDKKITDIVETLVGKGKKILVVCNKVKRAQTLFYELSEQYPDIPIMLIHSRFKRKDRQHLEEELMNRYNKLAKECIVVSTQVVEVSLDISFDILVTECAPIDALIQRCGRINRKRIKENVGHYCPVYVTAPLKNKTDNRPYDYEVLLKSYEALPDGQILQERQLQNLIDYVYPNMSEHNIDYSGVAFMDGEWILTKLCHRTKFTLLDLLDMDSSICVTESDREEYISGDYRIKLSMEIPICHNITKNLLCIPDIDNVYVVPDEAYSESVGLMTDKVVKHYEII